MTDPKADKKTESITALKNANQHLSAVFADITKKERTLGTCADDLERVARQCGDLMVSVWVGQKQETISLKTYLVTIAKTLNEAR